MPTITVRITDLEKLLQRRIPDGRWLDDKLSLVKGELKEWRPHEDEAKIELNDTNRPDLWTVEGIARQIHGKLTGAYRKYHFVADAPRARIEVDASMECARPFVAAFIAKGLSIDDAVLRELIQAQEKLSDTLGRRRRSIAIGIYKLNGIAFPVEYRAVRGDEVEFVPLGMDEPMTPSRIVEEHPKGREYRHALPEDGRFPILVDSEGTILSMPPIINSNDVGCVEPGDSDLFVEATGTDLKHILVALNILAANLSDRGAVIERVESRYPYDTPLGQNVAAPCALEQRVEVSPAEANSILGTELSLEEMEGDLLSYGLNVKRKDTETLVVTPPFYRHDLLHPVDVVEDMAISKGYDFFSPLLPECFTVGRLSAIEELSDRVRDILSWGGCTEIVSPILTTAEKLAGKCRRGEKEIIKIANVMTENYSVVRNWILPSLLEVESESQKAPYPHRMFEVGETALRRTSNNMGSETRVRAGMLLADPKASFSEAHSLLEWLLFHLKLDSELEECDLEWCIPGRGATITVDTRAVGWIGELHPEVLENWGIKVPAAAFELDLDTLMESGSEHIHGEGETI